MTERHPNIYNEFDLEAARKAGAADERERLIKFLEQSKNWNFPNGQLRDIFALIDEAIRGEQNA